MFVWGSILAWFVVLSITSSPGLYIAGIGIFEFDFLGVFYEVFQTATFWFYWPLATVIALGPTIVFRTLRLDLSPSLVDDVRLKMKKEGPRLFRRAMLKKKLPRISFSAVKERTGYAFSHQGGFGRLILSGRIFGQPEEQVRKEREKRISTIIASNPTSPALLPNEPFVHLTVNSRQANKLQKSTPVEHEPISESLPGKQDSAKEYVSDVPESTPVPVIESSRFISGQQESIPGSVSPEPVQMDQLPAESDETTVTPASSAT